MDEQEPAPRPRRRIPPELTAHLKLLSLTELALILGVDVPKAVDLVERGEIHAVRFAVGGRPYIPLKSVEAWQERVARGESTVLAARPRPLRRGRPPTAR